MDARLLTDRGVAVAFAVVSGRNCIVDGQRMAVAISQAFRVRRELRAGGYSHLIRGNDFPAGTPLYDGHTFLIRSRNLAAVQWMHASKPELLENAPERQDEVPGIEARVEQYPATAFAGDSRGIRPATDDDLEQCAALINRTHAGLDMFRPYTREWLSDKLDGRTWSTKPDWWAHVYGRREFHVLERDGCVLACGGLWDRGRDTRETWRLPGTDESRTISTTALLDFGYEDGHAQNLATLVRWFLGHTYALGRDYMLAPLQFLPEVAGLLAYLGPIPETRGVVWRTIFDSPARVRRPYVDLAYW